MMIVYLCHTSIKWGRNNEDEVVIACLTRGKKRAGPPTREDWENVEVFMRFLQVFYEVTLWVSYSLVPMSHTTLHDVKKIKITNARIWFLHPTCKPVHQQRYYWCDNDMRAKYDKYFGFYLELNLLLVIALVLGQRFKLRHATCLLRKQVLEIEAQIKTKQIIDVMHALFEE